MQHNPSRVLKPSDHSVRYDGMNLDVNCMTTANPRVQNGMSPMSAEPSIIRVITDVGDAYAEDIGR